MWKGEHGRRAESEQDLLGPAREVAAHEPVVAGCDQPMTIGGEGEVAGAPSAALKSVLARSSPPLERLVAGALGRLRHQDDPIHLDQVVSDRDVRMAQLGGGVRFSQEPEAALAPAGCVWRKRLERDRPLEPLVHLEVGDAHASLADLFKSDNGR